MSRKKEPKEKGPPSIGNKKAYHLYHIEETLEAGIALKGAEVKSLRAGKANLQDGYAKIMNGEVVLIGLYIQPYENQNTFYDIEPDRTRKLLLHKKQIEKLQVAVSRKGYTLVPTKVYFTRGIVKVAIGLGKGKKSHDKREDLKQKEANREMDRSLKAAGHR